MRIVFGQSSRRSSSRSSPMTSTLPANFVDIDKDDSKLFHVNAEGQSCFSEKQAEAASTRLKEILFVDQLKDRLSKVPWEFPQSTESRSETLCNERVYGHAN